MTDDRIEDLAPLSERVMQWLELGAAYFPVALFAVGVFDLGLSLSELLVSGRFTDPNAVIDLIDTGSSCSSSSRSTGPSARSAGTSR